MWSYFQVDIVNLYLFFFWISYLILTSECADSFIPFNTAFNIYILTLFYLFFLRFKMYYFLFFLILKSLILTCVPKHEPPSHLPPYFIYLLILYTVIKSFLIGRDALNVCMHFCHCIYVYMYWFGYTHSQIKETISF